MGVKILQADFPFRRTTTVFKYSLRHCPCLALQHCEWITCNYIIAQSQVGSEGERILIWRIVTSTSNGRRSPCPRSPRRWSAAACSLGLGVRIPFKACLIVSCIRLLCG